MAVISSARFVPCLRDIFSKTSWQGDDENIVSRGYSLMVDLLTCKPLNSFFFVPFNLFFLRKMS